MVSEKMCQKWREWHATVSVPYTVSWTMFSPQGQRNEKQELTEWVTKWPRVEDTKPIAYLVL